MLHLENFFEKSFALLLTTPKMYRSWQIYLTGRKKCACIYQEHNFARILSLAR